MKKNCVWVIEGENEVEKMVMAQSWVGRLCAPFGGGPARTLVPLRPNSFSNTWVSRRDKAQGLRHPPHEDWGLDPQTLGLTENFKKTSRNCSSGE